MVSVYFLVTCFNWSWVYQLCQANLINFITVNRCVQELEMFDYMTMQFEFFANFQSNGEYKVFVIIKERM